MPLTESTRWYHSNRYSADSACEHCAGVVRHQPWCITQNATVAYAYAAVLNPDELTPGDKLILHALGTTWKRLCEGSCHK